MLSSIVAFSIFITNPTGTLGPAPVVRTSPYTYPGEDNPKEFPSLAECDNALKDVKSGLAEKLNNLYMAANNSKDSVNYRIQKAKFDSMQCLAVEKSQEEQGQPKETVESQPAASSSPKETPVVDTLPPKDSNTVELWRIGRFDEDGVFHGTAYNTKNYDTKSDCSEGFRKTWGKVIDKAIKEGADGDKAMIMLNQFKNKYSCEKIVVDKSVMEASAKRATQLADEPVREQQDQAYAQNSQPPQAVEAQPQPGYYQTPAPLGMYLPPSPTTNYRPIPQARPTRPYFMAENVRGYDGTWRWVRYQTVFYSPSQCWQSVREFLGNEERNLQQSYSAMQPTYAAADWYRTSMDALTYRRSHLSCVTTDN